MMAVTLSVALCASASALQLQAPRQPRVATQLRAAQWADDRTRVVFYGGDGASHTYGSVSPAPEPQWSEVARQLARRACAMDEGVVAESVTNPAWSSCVRADVLVGLGVTDAAAAKAFIERTRPTCFVADASCSEAVRELVFAGDFRPSAPSPLAALPWTKAASLQRLLASSATLLGRGSSEDALFAALFLVHALIRPVKIVASDINPSWEKGPVRNVLEFKKMVDCCGPQIFTALGDPKTKSAIDLLNAVDLRDQVGSYRVIVSNETPELEDFSLCILQQNNCFGCDAPILETPVNAMTEWRGAPLDQDAAAQIFVGHLDDPAASVASNARPWSWKIVVGANPAYDAFPMQHQIFYPAAKGDGLWYDPVFCVETLDGELVWTKRHYRCAPRASTPGLWTLTTLDNGVLSEEHWTTVDAADDLSWAVFHYTGAARAAGQSYQGALLCSEDGAWPRGADQARLFAAFAECGLEPWELYGHGEDASVMWSPKFTDWADANPPPLDRIGDMTVTKWRKLEREKAGV